MLCPTRNYLRCCIFATYNNADDVEEAAELCRAATAQLTHLMR